MSWLLVTQDYPPGFTGGIASWAEDLAGALHRAGETVEVLARATGETQDHDRASPWPVRRVEGRSWGRWQGLWAALAGVSRVGAGTTVLFSTWPLAALLGPVARRRGARVAIAFHGSDLTRLATPTLGFRTALRSAHALLPVSAFLAGELRRLGYPDSTVLPMPIDLGAAPRRAPPGAGLVCIARLTPLKGVDRAIRLASMLDEPLTVIGDGPQLSALRRSAPDVIWTGGLGRDELRTIAGRSRALILLPRADTDGTGAEGLGLVLLEAAALGLPVIGCRTGGVPEAVGPGLILEIPDDPAGELAKIQSFLADPEAGARARQWVEASHGAARCLEVLRAALGSPEARRLPGAG